MKNLKNILKEGGIPKAIKFTDKHVQLSHGDWTSWYTISYAEKMIEKHTSYSILEL